MLEPGMLRPATEAVLQTAPPAAFSAGAAACVQRNGAEQVGGEDRRPELLGEAVELGRWDRLDGREVPALLARKSSRPSASTASRTIFSAAPAFDTSPGALMTARPSAQSRSTAAGPRGSSGR